MMKKEYIYIEELLERFFEGETTHAEEEELYAFFSSKNVPEHLADYKSLFGYFESGLAEEVDSSEKMDRSAKPVAIRKRLLPIAIGVAVAVLLLLIQPLLNRSAAPDPFEGSYIVRNGIKIDNLEEIRPELEFTLQEALSQQEYTDYLFEMANTIEDPFTMIQMEIEAHYCEIIHQFEDEEIRKEIQNILQIECKEQL